MMRMAMSPAASGLLRELVRRAGCSRDRILLMELRSVECLLDEGELHPETTLADLQVRDAIRLLLAVLVLQAGDDVLFGRDADDARR